MGKEYSLPFLLEVKKMKFKILSKVKVITLAIAVALSSASYADDEQLLILQRNLLEAQNESHSLLMLKVKLKS